MATEFPDWRLDERGAFWEGPLTPITPESDIPSIIHALERNEPVFMENGVLLSACVPIRRALPFELRTDNLQRTFKLRAYYGVTPFHAPRVVSLAPLINVERYPRHPHLYINSPMWGHSELCVTFAADTSWAWPKDGLARFLDYTAIWLVKHMVWEATAEQHWLGAGAPHEPGWLLENVRVDAPCPCGTPGISFLLCCRQSRRDFVAHLPEMVMNRWVWGRPRIATNV